MDLFVINRFRGDEADVDISAQDNKQLEKLKNDIEQRKKAKKLEKKSEPKVSTPSVTDKRQSDKINTANKKVENDIRIPDKNPEIVLNDPVKLKVNNTESTLPEFKVLGDKEFDKKPKVHRILPYWLSHPYAVSKDLQNTSKSIDELHWLETTVKSTLISEGITHLFPVQAEVIPFILQEHSLPECLWPHDVCVSAPTGSGKTLAFVIPIIQVLMKETSHHIRAMVVLPVQELAAQIAKVFKKYCARTGIKVALLSGFTPLQQEQQQIVRYTESLGWVSQADIIVCTAGRLVEHIQNTEGFSLKHLKFLVIDEADRIMDHIQNDWLYHMDRHIMLENELMSKVSNLNWHTLSQQKPPPHKLLFSATLSQDPEKLEQWGLFQPKLFSAAPINTFEDDERIRKYTTPDELIEKFVTVTPENKPLALYHFLMDLKWDKVLCFTNAAQTAHKLAVLLNVWGNGQLKVAELSAAIDRSTREEVLRKFTNSEINVLIGTDALARGIDIPDCNYVVSYDPPRNTKTYVHRVGRTGRAGRIGHAVTIVMQNQMNFFKEIIQSGGKKDLSSIDIQPAVFEGLSESYQHAIQETKHIIQNEVSNKVRKAIEVKRGFKPGKRKRETKS